jgi:hypothetical protein
MKTAVTLLLSLAAIAYAQDRKIDAEPRAGAGKKRLESVTWDLKSHKLVWVIQRGSEKDGEFVASASDRYEISPDDAVMTFSEERRGFTRDEATSLHKLLDTLSLYCAESVIWWDQGEGTPLDGKTPSRKARPIQPKEAPSPNRQRVEHERPEAPVPTLLVAEKR